MKIVAVGQRNFTGAGVLYAAFCDSLKALVFVNQIVSELNPSDTAALSAARKASSDDDINIWFHPHADMASFRGSNVVWSIFEATRLTRRYLDSIAAAEVIWTPSVWGHDVLVSNGVSAAKIDVVPEGVDTRTFHPFLRGAARNPARPFHFLAVGKFEGRKSYGELLAAFASAFPGDPNVRLAIKADYFANTRDRTTDLRALIAQHPTIQAQVKIISGRYDLSTMAAFYNFADAFVFPSRSEGWGLPLIEAMAAGIPAITTFYSGHTEYLRASLEDVSVVDHEMIDIDDEEFKGFWAEDGDCGQWARPVTASHAALMKQAFKNHEPLQAKAFAASDRIRQQFTWDNAVSIGLGALRQRGRLPRAFDIDLNFD